MLVLLSFEPGIEPELVLLIFEPGIFEPGKRYVQKRYMSESDTCTKKLVSAEFRTRDRLHFQKFLRQP